MDIHNELGSMFRIMMQRIIGMRIIDITVGDDYQTTLLMENGDILEFRNFSYVVRSVEDYKKIKEELQTSNIFKFAEEKIDDNNNTSD